VSNQIEPTLSLDGAASKEGVTGDKNSDAAAVLSLKNVKVHFSQASDVLFAAVRLLDLLRVLP
jgi:hypothetical protein